MNQLTLFLLNKKGYSVLQGLIEKLGPESIRLVVTAQDPGVQNDYSKEIENLCRSHDISVLDRKKFFSGSELGFCFAVGWKWLIKPYDQLVVFHDSLLPRLRGFNPLVTALINGHPSIGVTALWATEEYDQGKILLQKAVKVRHPLKIQTAIDLVIPLYVDMACRIGQKLVSGQKLTSKNQIHSKATFSLWRDELDYKINWSLPAKEIERFILAVGEPYAGALSHLNQTQVRILDCKLEKDLKIENRVPGKVFAITEGCPVVVCGKGLLRLTHVVDAVTGQSVLPLTQLKSRFN